MPTGNVVLTDYQAELAERLVSSGRYQNASEVLLEDLRLVEDQEADGKARIKALRDAARIGIADIDAAGIPDGHPKGRGYHSSPSSPPLAQLAPVPV
jgi:antitoxin ParD1/3/4